MEWIVEAYDNNVHEVYNTHYTLILCAFKWFDV